MWGNVTYSYTGRPDKPDRLFYMPKPSPFKLICFLKSSCLTYLLNELGRTGFPVGWAIGP